MVWFDTTPRGRGVPSGVDQLRALGEPVGVGAAFDDGAAEGESVDDGGAEPRVGEDLGPAGEGLVGRDPLEQPPLIRATMARAASGRSVLLMFSPRVP